MRDDHDLFHYELLGLLYSPDVDENWAWYVDSLVEEIHRHATFFPNYSREYIKKELIPMVNKARRKIKDLYRKRVSQQDRSIIQKAKNRIEVFVGKSERTEVLWKRAGYLYRIANSLDKIADKKCPSLPKSATIEDRERAHDYNQRRGYPNGIKPMTEEEYQQGLVKLGISTE